MARAALFATGTLGMAGLARGQEVSPPAILQDFESSWQTITNRTPDIFAAGYGGVYNPASGRAESGNQSVGYDVYDRFDLGSAGNPTLYGTANGLKNMVSAIHTMGGDSYIDLVWNQSGFADDSTLDLRQRGGTQALLSRYKILMRVPPDTTRRRSMPSTATTIPPMPAVIRRNGSPV